MEYLLHIKNLSLVPSYPTHQKVLLIPPLKYTSDSPSSLNVCCWSQAPHLSSGPLWEPPRVFRHHCSSGWWTWFGANPATISLLAQCSSLGTPKNFRESDSISNPGVILVNLSQLGQPHFPCREWFGVSPSSHPGQWAMRRNFASNFREQCPHSQKRVTEAVDILFFGCCCNWM